MTAKVADQASSDLIREDQAVDAQSCPAELLVTQPFDEARHPLSSSAELPKAVLLGSPGKATSLLRVECRAPLDRAPRLDREWATHRDRADDRPNDQVTLGDVLDDDPDGAVLAKTVHRPFAVCQTRDEGHQLLVLGPEPTG
jgi:hypothetical protein